MSVRHTLGDTLTDTLGRKRDTLLQLAQSAVCEWSSARSPRLPPNGGLVARGSDEGEAAARQKIESISPESAYSVQVVQAVNPMRGNSGNGGPSQGCRGESSNKAEGLRSSAFERNRQCPEISSSPDASRLLQPCWRGARVRDRTSIRVITHILSSNVNRRSNCGSNRFPVSQCNRKRSHRIRRRHRAHRLCRDRRRRSRTSRDWE